MAEGQRLALGGIGRGRADPLRSRRAGPGDNETCDAKDGWPRPLGLLGPAWIGPGRGGMTIRRRNVRGRRWIHLAALGGLVLTACAEEEGNSAAATRSE